MTFNVRREAPGFTFLAGLWLSAWWAWPRVPEKIAIHFNAEGVANGFGGKTEGLLLLPAMASVLYAASMLSGDDRSRPRTLGLFVWPYQFTRVGVLATLSLVHMLIISRALGWHSSADLLALCFGVFVVVLGNYLPKTQPNEFIGVRTSWTLSSDLAWHRTHRLAGKLFIVSGLATIAAAVARPGLALSVLLATVIVTALVSVVYSYVVWRGDPARGSDAPQGLMR